MSNDLYDVSSVIPIPTLSFVFNTSAYNFLTSSFTFTGNIGDKSSVITLQNGKIISYIPAQRTFSINFRAQASPNTPTVIQFNTVNFLPGNDGSSGLSAIPSQQVSNIVNTLPFSYIGNLSSFGKIGDGANISSQLGSLDNDILNLVNTQVSPSQLFTNILNNELQQNQSKSLNATRLYELLPPTQQSLNAYILALQQAIVFLKKCAFQESGQGSGGSIDKNNQMGQFILALQTSLYGVWNTNTPFSVYTKTVTNSTLKKSLILSQPTTEIVTSPTTQVSIELTQAELQQTNSNQPIFVTSSGVNIFTNPISDPNNINSILDIMRQEYTVPLKSNTIVNITTVQNAIAQGSFNNTSVQTEILQNLTKTQINNLITVTNNQINTNITSMEKLIVIINKIQNSTSFSIASCWAGLSATNINNLGWNGTNYNQTSLTTFLNNIQQAAFNLTSSQGNTVLSLLNSANSIGLILNSNPLTLPSLGSSFLTGDYSSTLNILSQNSVAIQNALKNITQDQLNACSNIAQIVSVGVSSKQITSAANGIQTLSMQTINNLLSKVNKLNNTNNQQINLQSTLATLQSQL